MSNLYIITGPAGVGKSTISKKIADSAEREKLKQYYESGAWFWGLMWANSVMGGY